MLARQAVIAEPFKTAVREAELASPAANQILVETEASAVSPGTELAVYGGTHQWLQDPKMTDWKFPFRPGYSAAGIVLAVGSDIKDVKAGDRVAYPGNHASHELLTLGHERGRWWKLPEGLPAEKAAWSCIARYGLGAAIRPGLTLGRSAAVLGLGVIGQFSLRALKAAGAYPVVGIDAVAMRRQAALNGGADFALDPTSPDLLERLSAHTCQRGAEIVADATGIPDVIPQAMKLACDGGQVVVVGSPRGKAKEVNFYDDLHRRYIEVTGAHGNMLFEPAHTRLAGAWDIHKAQRWLLAALHGGQLRLEGLVTHVIQPDQLGEAYEGLLKQKETWLGALLRWK